MALGFEKLTEKMKHSPKEERSESGRSAHHEESGSIGRHGHHEGKKGNPPNPVLIERPGACKTSNLGGKDLRVAIVASHWYDKVVHPLVDACSKELLAKGVAEDCLHLVEVAGAFELPFTAARLINCKDKRHRPDAVICIGCFVNDSTHMSETMSNAVAYGIMKLNVTSDTPVIFGVLCCDSESQAHSCTEMRSCTGIDESQECNHGVSWAQSALQMAHLKRNSAVKEMERCSCTRCVGRGGGESGEHKSEKHKSTSKNDLCTSCKSSTNECLCEDCRCRSCCVKREACRCCGCPRDKCSCQGSNCDCSSKNEKGLKTSSSEQAAKQDTKLPSHERGEHGISLSSGDHDSGSSSRCGKCGSPGGSCKCGLLH